MTRRVQLALANALIHVCLPVLTLSAPSVHGAVLAWEFSVHPSVETVPMTPYARGAVWDGGTGAGTPYGGAIPGTGLQGDGTAIFADSPAESSNSGFVHGGMPGDFTMDLRVKVLEDVTSPAGKSISIRQIDTNGRGIALNKANITYVTGTGVAGGPFAVDLTDYQILRISVVGGATNTATNYLWNPGSSTWTNIGSSTMGGSGAAAEVVPAGIAIGSMAGSSTQSGKFVIDYARLDDTAALADTVPPLPGPAVPVCLQTVTPADTQSVTGYPGGAPYPFASVDLDLIDAPDGITTTEDCCDGNFEPASIGGRFCHRNSDPPSINNYMYFAVDDTRVFNGSIQTVTVTVDYFDIGTGTLTLQYDGTGSPFTSVPLVTLADTNTWMTASVNLTDAKFANSQNGGADFRIAGDGASTFYIDTITLRDSSSNGPHIDYTIGNAGNSAFDWTVSEVTCDGTANDYPWLTLSATSGLGLGESMSAPVVAMIDTTTLAPGPQTAYLRFASNCPQGPCLDEPFTYTSGNLNGQGGWAATGDNFNVEAGVELKLDGGGDSSQAFSATHTASCIGEVITVKADLKLGGAANPEANFWQLRAYDAGGNNLGLWQGTQFNVAAKELAGTNATPAGAIAANYQTLEMRINAGCRTTDYYYNNTHVVSYPWSAAATGALANVAFVAINGRASSATDYVLLDNLSVTGTGDHIRRIDLNVVGCSIVVLEPRIRTIGQCPDTTITTEDFTIKNDGAFPWTGFTAAQFGTARPWLSGLTFTSGPVGVGGTATVTATIDWSQVTVSEGANVRFGATCDGSNFVFDTPAGGGLNTLNVTAPAAPGGFKFAYHGNVLPDNSNSAGAGFTFAQDVDPNTIEQGSIVIDSDATDGLAYQLVDLTDTAASKTKWRLLENGGNHVTIDANVGATLVSRLKTTVPAGSNDISQENLIIYDAQIAASLYWGGPDGYLGEGMRGARVTLPSDDQYHIVRLTSQDLGPVYGVQVRVYVDENPVPVLVLNNAGAVSVAPGGFDGLGFGCSRSTAFAQTISYDWITGTNKGVFAPGEEDSCIGSLIPANVCAPEPFADVDKDGDVDIDDFGVFQLCYTGGQINHPPIPTIPVYCACLDRGDNNNDGQPDSDGDIDQRDFIAFINCATGANVPWTPALTPDCIP